MHTHSNRKLLCAALAALLAVCLTGAALAAEAQLKTTRAFLDYLDVNGVRYSLQGMDDDGDEGITITYQMDNFDVLTCRIYFYKDCEQVCLRIRDIVRASAGKNYILSTINSLNSSYRWGKFVYDESDATVLVEMDMYIDPDHCAPSVYDAMTILFTVVDYDEVARQLHALE